MLKHTAMAHFGTQTAIALRLNINQAAVSQWGEVIPEKQAGRLERLTGGFLKFEEAHYQTDRTAQPTEAA